LPLSVELKTYIVIGLVFTFVIFMFILHFFSFRYTSNIKMKVKDIAGFKNDLHSLT